MPLANLLSLVENIRPRIIDPDSALRQNEALTRSALIDPLLRELGWDTEDPALVRPEDKVPGGRVDYTLYRDDGEPIMVVEAKRLGTPLRKGLKAAIAHTVQMRARYFSVTDGRRWEIYELRCGVSLGETPIAKFDLMDGSAAEACLKIAALSRSRVTSGRIGPEQAPGGVPASNRLAQPEVPIPNTPPPLPPDRSEPEWKSLSKCNPLKVSHLAGVRFPDGERSSVTKWVVLLYEVVRWFVAHNYPIVGACPIPRIPQSQLNAVHTIPFHQNGRQFRRPRKVGPVFVDGDLSRKDSVRATITVIERLGQDPAQFEVLVS